MYENHKCGYKNAVRHKHYCRGPPDNRVVAIYSRSKDNRWHGRQNKITQPLNPQSNEAIKVSYPLNRPMPSFRHGPCFRPVDCHRPVQHRAVHRKQLQITRAGVADGDAHGEELCARIGNIDKCNFGKLLGSRSNNLSSSPLPDNERRQGV